MKKRKKWLIAIIILAAIIVISVVFVNAKQKEFASIKSNYEVEVLNKRNLVNSISATGTFESNEKASVSSELANCKIKTVRVEVGDKVKAGDLICEFDSEDIEENLKQAKKDLETAKEQNVINENTAQRNVSDAKSSRVNQYDMATDSINNAKESWESAVKERDKLKEKYENAKSKFEECDRTLKATDSKTNPEGYAVAQTAWAEAKTAREGLKTQYEAAVSAAKTAKSAYEKVKKERTTSDTANSSNVANMENTLKNTKINNTSTIDGLQNKVDTYKKQLKKTTVKAESDGVVTSLNVTEGQTYTAGDIAVIENAEELVITAEIEEYEISDICEDMKVKVKTEATKDEVLEGTISYVSPVASGGISSTAGTTASSSVTYKIKVTLNEENERIRLGMTAKMSIVTDEVESVFAVPYDAVQEKENGDKIVYVIDEKQEKVEETKSEIKVQTGLESNYYVEITGQELKEGMSVYVPINDSGASSMSDMMNAMEGRRGNDGER